MAGAAGEATGATNGSVRVHVIELTATSVEFKSSAIIEIVSTWTPASSSSFVCRVSVAPEPGTGPDIVANAGLLPDALFTV